MRKCLAIDIGGTKISVAIIENNTILAQHKVATPSSSSPEAMTQCLNTLLSPLASDIDYVAIASTGIITNGNLHAINPDNLGGLSQYPLKSTVEQITNKPTFVINDVQAAAFAEYQALSDLNKDMAFITVSTGVGAGLVINGELLIGDNGIAGHVGHSLADINGPRCGCGRIGCVEAIASGSAITKQGLQSFGEGNTAKEVFEHYRNGDERAKEIITKSATAIANVIADLKITLDIKVIKLGGSVGLAKGYIELVRSVVNQMPKSFHLTIEPALYGSDAGLIGVAKWAECKLGNHLTNNKNK